MDENNLHGSGCFRFKSVSRSKIASIGDVSQVLCFAIRYIPPHRSHIVSMFIGFISTATYLAGVGWRSRSSLSQGRAAHSTPRSVTPWGAPQGVAHSRISDSSSQRLRYCNYFKLN